MSLRIEASDFDLWHLIKSYNCYDGKPLLVYEDDESSECSSSKTAEQKVSPSWGFELVDILYILENCRKESDFRRSDIFYFELPNEVETRFNGFETDAEAADYIVEFLGKFPYYNIYPPVREDVMADVYSPLCTKVPNVYLPPDTITGDLELGEDGKAVFIWHRFNQDTLSMDLFPIRTFFDAEEVGLTNENESFPVFGFLKHGIEIDPETLVLDIDDLYWLDDAPVLKIRLGLEYWLDMDEAMDNEYYKRQDLEDYELEEGDPEKILYPEIYDIITLDSIPFVKKDTYEHTGFDVSVSIGGVEGKVCVYPPEAMKGVEYNPRYCHDLLDDAETEAYRRNQY